MPFLTIANVRAGVLRTGRVPLGQRLGLEMPAVDWLERYRKFWECRFDQLEKLLDEMNDPK